ncbi:YitT family protein [Metabacillus sp. HB246100]|uniref:YitT family protein n=1 Tax=Bacillus weihaiensis TaxID=1547283 RepID=UPI002354BC8E|nr:YitT family protein [Bacillus weihaiensis]
MLEHLNLSRKACFLALGASIQGLAMSLFLFPHYIPSGGAASISVLVNHFFSIPFSITLIIVNGSLLLAAVKWLGKGNALWTMYCVTITSFIIQVLSPYIQKPFSFILLDLGIGSVLFGIGLGILFRMGASSGGMDILALVMAKITKTSPGKLLFCINGLLLLSTGVLVDIKIILYALCCQFISTRIVDIIYQLQLKQNSPILKKAS